MADPRFDSLTPPRDIFDRFQPSILFELFDRDFLVSGSSRLSPQRFSYDVNSAFILEALETGHLTADMCDFVTKFGSCCYEDGFMVCECLDRRFKRELRYRIRLETSQSVFAQYYQSIASGNPLVTEQTVLSVYRPVICTDPSPDVARAQSVLDFRAKMWQPRERSLRPETSILTRPTTSAATNVKSMEQFKRVRLELPEDMSELFLGLVKT
jgi:hypothetical protein